MVSIGIHSCMEECKVWHCWTDIERSIDIEKSYILYGLALHFYKTCLVAKSLSNNHTETKKIPINS